MQVFVKRFTFYFRQSYVRLFFSVLQCRFWMHQSGGLVEMEEDIFMTIFLSRQHQLLSYNFLSSLWSRGGAESFELEHDSKKIHVCLHFTASLAPEESGIVKANFSHLVLVSFFHLHHWTAQTQVTFAFYCLRSL